MCKKERILHKKSRVTTRGGKVTDCKRKNWIDFHRSSQWHNMLHPGHDVIVFMELLTSTLIALVELQLVMKKEIEIFS